MTTFTFTSVQVTLSARDRQGRVVGQSTMHVPDRRGPVGASIGASDIRGTISSETAAGEPLREEVRRVLSARVPRRQFPGANPT